MFVTYEVSLEMVAAIRPILELVGARDRNLADQMRRAASSVPMNLAEGAERAGRDKSHSYRIASGSAKELRAALQIATAWGYIRENEARSALELLDRLGALLWRLNRANLGDAKAATLKSDAGGRNGSR
jgi:four helix bundle protein